MSAQPAVTSSVSTDRFALEINRPAVDRSFGIVVGLFSVLIAVEIAALCWIATLDAGALALLSLLPTLVFLLVLVALYCYAWGSTRAIEWPLQVSYRGLVFCTPRGRVEVPWEAVTQVSIDRRLFTQQLTVRLHPQAGPGAPGVVSTLPAGGWRVIRRAGLRLSLRVVRAEPAEVAAAVATFSGGRWRPQPVS